MVTIEFIAILHCRRGAMAVEQKRSNLVAHISRS